LEEEVFLSTFDHTPETIFNSDRIQTSRISGTFVNNETSKSESEISNWLESIKITEQDKSKIISYGLTVVSDFKDLSEEDWKAIDCTPFSRKKILKKLIDEEEPQSFNFRDYLINVVQLEPIIADAIIKYGVTDQSNLMELEDSDLIGMGVDKQFTRKKILNKINQAK